MTTTKPKPQRIAKINKERRLLMKLLAGLRKDINYLLQDVEQHETLLNNLFSRRKDYRKRLAKLTDKLHRARNEK